MSLKVAPFLTAATCAFITSRTLALHLNSSLSARSQ